jgi:hypothetical protein
MVNLKSRVILIVHPVKSFCFYDVLGGVRTCTNIFVVGCYERTCM